MPENNSKWTTGLVSITFRKLSPEAIIALVQEAKLDAIEWGGDVHVPHGDKQAAERVGKQTRDAGLAVSSYGSYYRAGESEAEGLSFDAVVESAVALQAPVIRVWAGRKGPKDADEAYRARVIDDTRRIAELASGAGIRVGVEYHGNTLTETNESAQRFLCKVDHPNLEPYWQPPNGRPVDENRAGLEVIAAEVSVVHVFHWVFGDSGKDMRPLKDGAEAWTHYFDTLQATPRERVALLEFVREGTEEQFLEDAAVLRDWLGVE